MNNQLIKILTKKTIKNEVKHMIKSQKKIEIRITKFEHETDKNIIFFQKNQYIIYIYRKNQSKNIIFFGSSKNGIGLKRTIKYNKKQIIFYIATYIF